MFTLCRNDKRFFIKTQSRREVAFLLSNLERYAAHLEKYPHSLLVRFLGEKTATRSAKPAELALVDQGWVCHLTDQLIGQVLSSPDRVGELNPPNTFAIPLNASAALCG